LPSQLCSMIVACVGWSDASRNVKIISGLEDES
jgi:hypothetical protein